jgi:two-component system, OmpR family, KDP operon response regulator KdpE
MIGQGLRSPGCTRVAEIYVAFTSARENSNRSLMRRRVICSIAVVESAPTAARGRVDMSSKSHILVVDDEPGILRFLRVALIANDFAFASARSVQEATQYIASHEPNVVVLDLGLPDGDGKEVIRRVREWSDVPIIVISARDREAEKIEALDLGADDFVTKPFGVGELMARIRAALRNRAGRPAETGAVRIADVEIDPVRHRVKRAGQEVRLTPKEFELLAFLAQHGGAVVAHGQILTAIWGPAHASDIPYLRVHIGRLRHKIEDDPNNPKIVLTEPGVGYRIAQPDPAGATD